ncbi:hypothetical protein BACI71_60011 [Bacillus mycoides]|uniref:Uncharacterized protein n=1 Tax=Bacillus mycoides TaxID=1405 RepID=A0A654AP08_BACMY|nr:hypothetical protein BACI71_60011 [Bacillus mycoides]
MHINYAIRVIENWIKLIDKKKKNDINEGVPYRDCCYKREEKAVVEVLVRVVIKKKHPQ